MKYTLLRLGLTLILTALFLWLGAGALLSVIAAVIAAWCLSYLFFTKLREESAQYVKNRINNYQRKDTKTQQEDSAAEDQIDPNSRPAN